MDLIELLSPTALKKADEEYKKNEEAFEKRVAANTAKRLSNNLARFGDAED